MADLATRPTILIVPGGWHPPSSYSNLIDRLDHLSYPVTALQNPSLNSSTKGLVDDIAHVQSALKTLIEEEGKDVVVTSHSYGGLPAMVGVTGYAKIKRKEAGKKGGVVGMLYLVTTALPPGISLVKAKAVEEWKSRPGDGENKIPPPKNAHHLFYNDLTPEEVLPCLEKLEPQGFLAFDQEMPPYNRDDLDNIPSVYLACRDDHAVKLASQKKAIMLLGKRCTMEWCDASHSPFVSRPELICDILGFLGRNEMLD